MSRARSEQAPARRRRLAPDERRRQILAVAREHFAARPYADVATTDIATDAGVSHGLLTYHFGSKRKLYLTVLRTTLRIPTIEVPPGETDDFLDAMTDWWLDQLAKNRELWIAALSARTMGQDPDVEAFLDSIERRAREDLIEFLTAQDPAAASPELWAIVAAWQGLAESAGLEWQKHERITREQAKVLIRESLRHLLRLEKPLQRAHSAQD